MKAIPLLLALGTGLGFFGAAGSVVALQQAQVGPDLGMPFLWVVPLSGVVGALGVILYAGRVLGRWESSQANLISEVRENTALRERVARLEGQVKMLELRTRSPFPDAEGQAQEAG